MLDSKKGSSSQSLPTKKRRAAPGAFSRPEIRDSLARDKNKSWLYESKEPEDDDEPDLVRPSQLEEETRKRPPIDVSAKGRHNAVHKQTQLANRQTTIQMERRDRHTVENHLTDPLRLANAVLERLKASDIDGALRYVRGSEAVAINNIVSWNHCMDWLMAQGDMKEALAIYNDMKKRGRRPDAHTYTIMLRGLAQQVHKHSAVKEAVKIYNSMSAPNSTVKPNTIHTNAIINVCARGGDMEALFSIAGQMPERGPGCPDRTTYTTILNAIRENTIKEVAKLTHISRSSNQRTELFQKAVDDARKIWEDISFRWRRADLIIDEYLVCAMGRVLQGCGVGKDLEQVLDLIETTMNFRIPQRHNTHLPAPSASESLSQAPSSDGLSQDLPEISPAASSDSALLVGWQPRPTSGSNSSQPKSQPGKSGMPLGESSIYATPGPKTLSLLLDTAIGYRKLIHLAPAYWHMLTNSNGKFCIKPDAANVMAYLRILRVNHNSQAAYELLSQNWPDNVAKTLYRRGSFVLAIRTCIRDKNNPNVFRTAQKIMDLMQQKLEERSVGMFQQSTALAEMHGGQRKKEIARLKEERKELSKKELDELTKEDESVQSLPIDPKVLSSFLNIAVRTTKGWNEGIRGRDEGDIFERNPTKNHTVIALKRVGPMSVQLKRLMTTKLNELQYDDLPGIKARGHKDPRFGSRVGDDIQDLVDLMRTLISTCDRIVNIADRFKEAGKEELDQKMVENCNNWKRIYSFYMQRVEKTLGPHLFNKANTNEAEMDKENEDIAEQEDDNIAPAIERQIRAALGEATAEMLETRDVQKGRSVKHVGDVQEPKWKSRVLKSQYDTKVKKAMRARNLDPDLDMEDDDVPDRRRNTYHAEDERGHGFGSRMNATGARKSDISSKRPTGKPPQIGDELDLDDEDEDTSVGRFTFARRPPREEVPFDRGEKQAGSRILNRPDVQRVWNTASQNPQRRTAAAAY